MRFHANRADSVSDRIAERPLHPLAVLVLVATVLATSGCEFLAGAAVGGTAGYIAGHESGEDEHDDDDDE